MHRVLVLVEVGDEVLDAALVLELGGMTLGTLVNDRDFQAAHEEGRSRRRSSSVWKSKSSDSKMSASGRNVTVVTGAGALRQLLALLQRGLRRTARVLLAPDVAVAADLHTQLLGERVDDRDPDPVQASGDLVAAALTELAARVQDGQDHFHRRLALLLHRRDGDAAAVVEDGHGVVGVDRDRDFGAEPRQRLVDGVVDDLVDEVVQARHAGGADIHAGSLADGLEPLEDGYVLCVIAGVSRS